MSFNIIIFTMNTLYRKIKNLILKPLESYCSEFNSKNKRIITKKLSNFVQLEIHHNKWAENIKPASGM